MRTWTIHEDTHEGSKWGQALRVLGDVIEMIYESRDGKRVLERAITENVHSINVLVA